MKRLLTAIAENQLDRVEEQLRTHPGLATQRVEVAEFYDTGIFHWLYVSDTALHLAAAGYRSKMIRMLVTAGADPNAAANHRRSTPLHYAADGSIVGPAWDAARQVEAIHLLLHLGADLRARDKNGATALHRAVRTRCAAAVRCLLDSGADPLGRNVAGSTPFHLAVQNTGRGGTGNAISMTAQREIIEEFLARGISPELKNGKGRTVLDCATSPWIRTLLSGHDDA